MTADHDRRAAGDPRTPPQLLADIATRRWDLHAIIVRNPATYPRLRQWIATVNPGAMSGAPGASDPRRPVAGAASPGAPAPRRPAARGSSRTPPYAPRPRTPSGPYVSPPGVVGYPAPPPRSRRGCWFAGCGCLGVVGFVIALLLVLSGLGGAISATGPGSPTVPSVTLPPVSTPTPAPTPTVDPEAAALAEQLAAFATERDAYYALYSALDGNPVAALVARPNDFRRLERQAADPSLTSGDAASLAQQAAGLRQDLQQRIDAAAGRRNNDSGTIAEGLVDGAGNGFIDIRWDAADACELTVTDEWRTLGCVNGDDLLTVHLMPGDQFANEWMVQMITVHELAHVYQGADAYRHEDYSGETERLLAEGYFEGSREKMADCYSLTYYDQWSLWYDNTTVGYGYVCGDGERQAIRDWYAGLTAPLPRS